MTSSDARALLERCALAARQMDSPVILCRPVSFLNVLAADPSLIEYRRCSDLQHVPTYVDSRGDCWPVRVTEESYSPARVEKLVGATSRATRVSG